MSDTKIMSDTKAMSDFKIMSDMKISRRPKGRSTSRFKLLQWVNDLLQAEYTKIENLCSGVAYCQMLALIFPHSIQQRRVKINPKFEIEYIHNLRLLQDAFIRLDLDKFVPIDHLIQGRFKHNYEFLLWFRKFYDSNMPQLDVKKPAVTPSKSRFFFKGKSPTNKPEQNKQSFARASVIKPIKPRVKEQFPINTLELENNQTLSKVAEVKPRIIPKEESPINIPMNFRYPSELYHQLIIFDKRVQTQLQCIIDVRDLSYRKLLMIEQIVKTNDMKVELYDIFDRIKAVLAAPMNNQDRYPDANKGAGIPADTAYFDKEEITAVLTAPMNDQDSTKDNEDAGIPSDTEYLNEEEYNAMLAASMNDQYRYPDANEGAGILADTAYFDKEEITAVLTAPMNDQDSAEDKDGILADTEYFYEEEYNAMLAASMNDQDSAENNEDAGIPSDTEYLNEEEYNAMIAASMNGHDSAEDNEEAGIPLDTAYIDMEEISAMLTAPMNDQDSAEDKEEDGILADTAAPMNDQDSAEDKEYGILADTEYFHEEEYNAMLAASMNDQDSAEDSEEDGILADTEYFHMEEINAYLTALMNDQESDEYNEGADIPAYTEYFYEEENYAVLAAPMNDQDSAEDSEEDGILADTAAPMNDKDSAEDDEYGILGDTEYFHEEENDEVLAAPMNDQNSAEANEGAGIPPDTGNFLDENMY